MLKSKLKLIFVSTNAMLDCVEGQKSQQIATWCGFCFLKMFENLGLQLWDLGELGPPTGFLSFKKIVDNNPLFQPAHKRINEKRINMSRLLVYLVINIHFFPEHLSLHSCMFPTMMWGCRTIIARFISPPKFSTVYFFLFVFLCISLSWLSSKYLKNMAHYSSIKSRDFYPILLY